jgi:hypothetical protein
MNALKLLSLWAKLVAAEAGSLNKCSCLAPPFGVTKFTAARGMNFVTLCCYVCREIS